jgi:hypothetical protein
MDLGMTKPAQASGLMQRVMGLFLRLGLQYVALLSNFLHILFGSNGIFIS